MLYATFKTQEGGTIKRIVILELSDQDNVALEEISKILERHPDLKLIEVVN